MSCQIRQCFKKALVFGSSRTVRLSTGDNKYQKYSINVRQRSSCNYHNSSPYFRGSTPGGPTLNDALPLWIVWDHARLTTIPGTHGIHV